MPETLTGAASTHPPPTPSPSVTTAPAPMPRVPHGITNPHPPPQIAADGSQYTPSLNATSRPHTPDTNHTTNLNLQRTLPLDKGEVVNGVTEHELEHSSYFPIIFFKRPQKFQIRPTPFQDLQYPLSSSCQLHTSWTSHILFIFVFLFPV